MNVIEQAKQAYAPSQVAIRSERSVEAQLITQVTAALRKAAAGRVSDFPALAAALHRNREMWATLAANVADRQNGLPAPLRAQLFYLSEFTQIHTGRVLRREADTAPLIEINTAVLRGLNSKGDR